MTSQEAKTPERSEYDVIVVGSGSSGGALAGRLSESPGTSVLVLEAGTAYVRVDDIPSDMLDPSKTPVMPGHPANWNMLGEFYPGYMHPVARGKVLGGSSAVNGAYFMRGTRANFDHWAALGNDSWGFDEVLPYFIKLENDLDFQNSLHGTSGPIGVQRETPDRAPEFTNAFTGACRRLGFPEESDKNGDQPQGVGPVPLNAVGGQRISTALGYLLPNLTRPNLTIVGGAHVTRVLFENQRTVGVEAQVNGDTVTYRGGEVVICAGALRSPHLLMWSGIGDAKQLRQHNIDVVAHVPGVGQNLMDHPELVVNYSVDVPIPEPERRGFMTSALHWRSDGGEPAEDLEILPFVRTTRQMIDTKRNVLRHPLRTLAGLRGTSLRAIKAQVEMRGTGSIVVGNMQEKSRGEVCLSSDNPLEHPRITYRFLSSDVDRARFREAVRVLWEVFNTNDMRAIGGRLQDINAQDMNEPAVFDEWVKRHLLIAGHPSCTCKMGPESDEHAVVDQRARVRGVDGLRVVDTSIWPAVPSRGPNATAIMTGERVAAFMAAGN